MRLLAFCFFIKQGGKAAWRQSRRPSSQKRKTPKR
jgi:hypothetical protein